MPKSRSSVCVELSVALVALVSAPLAHAQATPDCTGPASDPAPGTAARQAREQDNDYCGEQHFYDTTSNPAFAAAKAANDARTGGTLQEDPFRDPSQLNGKRFHYQQTAFTNRAGQRLPAALFWPLRAAPPYPGVVIVHGGAATQEMYLWASEGLAEAGYMVLTFQIPEPDNAENKTHYDNAKDALDFFESTPSSPTARHDVNPLWAPLARSHVGLAGHSAGGVAVSRLGQEDPRVSAIVSWDRAQSSAMPADLKLRTPALFLTADFNCQKVPVCVPQPYTSPPDPKGPGNKDEDYQRLHAAG